MPVGLARDRPQRDITGEVAAEVVDALEVVDVAQHQREPPARA
jgi:hypothetical protein